MCYERSLSMASVINVAVKNLRKLGYKNVQEWMAIDTHLYVGRACHYVGIHQHSTWYNPFSVKTYGRQEAIRLYEIYVRENLYDRLGELEGKVLGCWCHPESCHADVLVRLVEERKNAK